MLFNSAQFLIFFPIVVLIYFLIPHKIRYFWILVTSYFFYMCWNPIYGLLLLGVTSITYFAALFTEKFRERKKLLLWATICVCLAVLAVFKYWDFILRIVNGVFGVAHIQPLQPSFSVVVPVGISFYLFQTMGYVIDVYRGKVKAEKNFFRYAAFISFFPQLVAGPIERATTFLPQFYEEHKFDYKRVKDNLLLMLWGLFLKIVIADRVAIFVDTVYDNYMEFDGLLVIIASVLFAFQIYCDFAGYSIIAVGAAGVMGFKLIDNFKAPYCAKSVKEFWSRWHISLTNWFRDYVYISLGGNRKGKLRKYINTLIVFGLSGLWHGSNWSFVFWGLLNGIYIVFEEMTEKFRNKVSQKLKPDRGMWLFNFFKSLYVFALVDFAWIFFRAPGCRDAVNIILHMIKDSHWSVLFDNTIHFYIMQNRVTLFMLISILLLIAVDICHSRNIHFRKIIEGRNIVFRWAFYYALIMAILVFGVWGPAFDAGAFIYFQF